MDRYFKDRSLDLTQLQQKISCTVSDIKAEAASFNSSVASAGLLQATKQKISEVGCFSIVLHGTRSVRYFYWRVRFT
jgi:hypothetical protein